MVTSVESAVVGLAEHGFRLRRATPRGRDRLSLEAWRGPTVHGGQWHRDPDSARRATQEIRSAYGDDSVLTFDGSALVLQRDGADPDVPGLYEYARERGAVLLSHRVGRRGVVRRASGDFTKVVRPKSLSKLVDSLRWVQAAPLDVPRVRSLDPRLGAVTTTALPGTTLNARLTDPDLDDDRLAGQVHALGVALRLLHAHPPPQDRTRHHADTELAATRRWLEAASEHELIPARRWLPSWEQAVAALAGGTTPVVCVHRDLHDKQVLTGARGAVGVLDLDLSCPGEAALDLGNLIAHLYLRALQGQCSEARADTCVHALLEGYAPDHRVRARMPAYLLSTRLRLAAVYAFRAAHPTVIDGLLHPGRDRELVP